MRLANMAAVATMAAVGTVGHADAAMILTPAAVTAGYQLTTFASGFETFATTSGNLGPLVVAFPASGGALVGDLNGKVRFFPTRADNQTVANATVTTQYAFGDAFGMTTVGGAVYMVQKDGTGGVARLNDDGSLNRLIVAGITAPEGIAGNPANGHLFVSNGGGNQVFEIDPAAGTKTLVLSQGFDGITLSADGRVLYGAAQGVGRILGFDLATGTQVFRSGPIAGLDGSALGYGSLAGTIFVNTNDGRLVQVDLATTVQTLIGTGGSRGDFVSVGPDGSLFLTQSDSVLRLAPPPGGTFVVAAPEPASLTLLALAAPAVLAATRPGRRPARPHG